MDIYETVKMYISHPGKIKMVARSICGLRLSLCPESTNYMVPVLSMLLEKHVAVEEKSVYVLSSANVIMTATLKIRAISSIFTS